MPQTALLPCYEDIHVDLQSCVIFDPAHRLTKPINRALISHVTSNSRRKAPSRFPKASTQSDFSRLYLTGALLDTYSYFHTLRLSALLATPMSSVAFARIARARLFNAHTLRTIRPARVHLQPAAAGFASSSRRLADAHDPHHEESFEEFTARYGHPFALVYEGQWVDESCGGDTVEKWRITISTFSSAA